MAKRFSLLIVSAGILSAMLLFAGTAVLDRLSPVYASGLPPLVAGGSPLASTNPSFNEAPSRGAQVLVQVASEDIPARLVFTPTENPSLSSQQPHPIQPLGSSTPNQATPQPITASLVTVAELSASPEQFAGKLVSVTGIATPVDGGRRLLLNDGTGQILIDLEDSSIHLVVATAAQVTIFGQFKVQNDGMGISACILRDGGTDLQLDSCENDHSAGSASTSTTQPTDDRSSPSSGHSTDSGSSGTSGTSGSSDNSGSSDTSGSSGGSGSSSGSGSNGSNSGSGSGSGSSGGSGGGHDDSTPHP